MSMFVNVKYVGKRIQNKHIIKYIQQKTKHLILIV